MGYTPLFDTLTKGTLCGRWPDIGLWPIVLSMADKNGVIDATPNYIAGVTGLPVSDVEACMKRFCEPDLYSRSQDAGGARLVLLDDHRDWGWQVVNHAKYREKARKASYDADRTSSGADAERKRASREVPRSPAKSRAGPLSDTDTNKDKDKREERAPAREPPPGLNLPAWQAWEAYRSEIRKPIKSASVLAAQRKLAGYGADQSAVVEQSIANSWTGLFPLKTDYSPKAKSSGTVEPPRAI